MSKGGDGQAECRFCIFPVCKSQKVISASEFAAAGRVFAASVTTADVCTPTSGATTAGYLPAAAAAGIFKYSTAAAAYPTAAAGATATAAFLASASPTANVGNPPPYIFASYASICAKQQNPPLHEMRPPSTLYR